MATPDEVVEHLRTCEVAPEVGPVATRGALGAMTSVYCRDPDGNLIEFASYDNRKRSPMARRMKIPLVR